MTDETGKQLDLKEVIPDEEVTAYEKEGRLAELRRHARREGRQLFDVDRFLERYDKNKDGFIEREELPERLRHAFDQIDANKDGKLSREELEKGAVYLQRQRRPADSIRVLVEMSDDDEASREELQYIYDLLRKMDKNNNGKLERRGVKGHVRADRLPTAWTK